MAEKRRPEPKTKVMQSAIEHLRAGIDHVNHMHVHKLCIALAQSITFQYLASPVDPIGLFMRFHAHVYEQSRSFHLSGEG